MLDKSASGPSSQLSGFSQRGWLHSYQMSRFGDVPFLPTALSKAEGCRVRDVDGTWYLDALSGAYCVNIGYGRQSVLDAASEAASSIHYVSPFSCTSPQAAAYSKALTDALDGFMGPESRIFFVNSGSEAIDAAIKLARAWHFVKGTGHKTILSRRGSYHGSTFGAATVSDSEFLKQVFGPMMGGAAKFPTSSCHICEFDETPDRCGVNCLGIDAPDPAALLVEAVETCVGTGLTHRDYYRRLRRIADDLGALLICDEVITGFGRTGALFACEKLNIRPDVLVLAKGITSGYEAMGAIVVRREVADAFLGDDSKTFFHGATFGARPGPAAAALASLDILLDEALPQAAARSEAIIRCQIEAKLTSRPSIRAFRGTGMLFSVDVDFHEGPARVHDIELLRQCIFEQGIINCLYSTKDDGFVDIAPPLICSEGDLEELVEGISKGFDKWENQRAKGDSA
ncbi:aminotransferase family protein [Litoreibacter roseus]|uniref:Aspartate aminotransferase family protein n=1 Tax=Litoreibacter roseus TaxID=2601869 RepID=A0A6N6JP84_9RHOB|nr:aminotransferase class III-fold pyridoxal phosphate-dependent enzyme [Litoreibacter roseus]GFE67292.1 aspartate aminotransferase family protein [Litoreibacter roseus]